MGTTTAGAPRQSRRNTAAAAAPQQRRHDGGLSSSSPDSSLLFQHNNDDSIYERPLRRFTRQYCIATYRRTLLLYDERSAAVRKKRTPAGTITPESLTAERQTARPRHRNPPFRSCCSLLITGSLSVRTVLASTILLVLARGSLQMSSKETHAARVALLQEQVPKLRTECLGGKAADLIAARGLLQLSGKSERFDPHRRALGKLS